MQKSTEHPDAYLWVKLADGRNVPCPDRKFYPDDILPTHILSQTHGFSSLSVLDATGNPLGWIGATDARTVIHNQLNSSGKSK